MRSRLTPTRRPRPAAYAAGALAVLVALPLVLALGIPGAPSPATAAVPRTWVVDAVDDTQGNRWESADTASNVVTISVGDTVEWQFDRATQGHDLTSQDERTAWSPPVQEYREPGGEPVRRTFTEPGVYWYLCAMHGTTMSGRIVVQAAGGNRPPTAAPEVSPREGAAPLVVHATANASDPDGDPVTVRWDFGTGRPEDVATTDHAMFEYAEPGHYLATLTVTDSSGAVHAADFPITVAGEGGSGVTASATPTTGSAPLDVALTGTAPGDHPEALTWAWDFGDGSTGTGREPRHTYTEPGTHTATVTVTHGDHRIGTASVMVNVSDGAPPEIDATASPSTGAGPLRVELSTAVTTRGTLRAFSHGTTAYPDLTGTAVLERRRGRTYAVLDVTGAKPSAAHPVHVHEQPCADDLGGAHFRFDETQPFAEANELWPAFTAGPTGASGRIEVAKPLRAGPEAVSVVVHDPDNAARRIGCADLAPWTGDLTYDWDFGDGTRGSGPDPDHVYAAPGSYVATVRVGHGSGAGARQVTDSVTVVVTGAPAPTAPTAPLGDTVAPVVELTRAPALRTRSRSATFAFASSEAGSRFECTLDGGAWQPCESGTGVARLRDGTHRLSVRATDAVGNVGVPVQWSWLVDRTAPTVRATRPGAVTTDRTPTIRARVTDALSQVRRRDVTVLVDGSAVPRRAYDPGRGRIAWTPPRPLALGRHTVRVVVRDDLGNRRVTTWRFTVRP